MLVTKSTLFQPSILVYGNWVDDTLKQDVFSSKMFVESDKQNNLSKI